MVGNLSPKALPLGNSESDSIGQLVFPTDLETDCRRETGVSRLSPTQPLGERLPTSFRFDVSLCTIRTYGNI
ncbi:MAG: hypothetical protein LBG58_08105 [Planctomycetaceae bacterium]|nr:hypothetical protein [Planctomycetaceae bacterium]